MKKLATLITTQILILSTTPVWAYDLQEEAVSTSYTQQIKTLAGNSSCRSYSWKNRGRAPAGYIKGVALSFARSVCRVRFVGATPAGAKIMSSANTGNTKKDALAHYQSTFAARGIRINTPGEDAVRAIYALGMGLGMRESSGAYCEGWDRSAGSNRSSAQAEAGIFQVSYDSMGASPELRKLYNEYKANPQRCQLETYKEGVTCRSQSILGTGAGADYQRFNKSCPAFAAEYAMIMLRVQRSHFGPINRKDAEIVPACNSLLVTVQKMIDADPEGVCGEIY